LADAWSRAVAQTEGTIEIMPDTFLHPGVREGMGPAPHPSGAIADLGSWVFDTATPLVEGTYRAARLAADAALTALDLVLDERGPVYALCRPPGHHAARSVYGGYCYFNNAGVAAQAALTAGATKAVVLDVDYHHGNGTQQLFYGRPDVMYASLHGDPNRAYPYYAGWADETGAGNGRGANLNVPLPEHVDDERYLAELQRAIDAIDRFGPDVVIVSLGVDTYELDPISDFRVTTEGFESQGRAVAALDKPTVVVQEGGYHVGEIGRNVHAFLRGVAGA
jgi:acetoin utilization deacetylase AcuC-like enzyme